MTGNYAYTPDIWPSFIATVFLIALSIYSWRRRSVPGALPFSIGCVFAALWAAGSVMEAAAVDVPTQIFWFKFQAVWQLPTATAITCFVLEYAWPGRWLTRRNLALLSIVPLLGLGLILTDDLLHLGWSGFAYEGQVIPLRAPSTWLVMAYAYGLGFLNLVVLAWLFRRSPQHRWPVVIMMTGQIVGRGLFLLEAAQVQIAPSLAVPPVAWEYLMYAIALFGFHIFDPIPLAHRTAIEQMREGMVVLDSSWRVANLNPAAAEMLSTSATHARGKLLGELLSAFPDVAARLTGAAAEPVEISLGAGPKARFCALELSLLKDFRGPIIGHLLLLRDVTEQRRAQAQIVEQQRTLAMLQERERLARELHDGLGQALAATHLQATTAKLLLARGEAAQANECLDNLADTTLQAEADVREYLLGARAAFSAGQPFFPALRQYVARFSQQYDLPVELSAPPQLQAHGLGTTVEVQLLRIIQEALSNVRKHARANNVQVFFAQKDRTVCIDIVDDGQGFEPADRRADSFGLQAMRERAETLGGHFEVISHPGQGTRVMVQVPIQVRQEAESGWVAR